MSVRLGFAVAAHLDAEIMLVDEVLAVGDAAFQRKCMTRIRELTTQEGRTIVFVSHNLPWVERLCDRVVLIDNGVVAATGRSRRSSPATCSTVDPVQHGGAVEIPDDHAAGRHRQAKFRRVRLVRAEDGGPTGSLCSASPSYSRPSSRWPRRSSGPSSRSASTRSTACGS